MLDMCGSVCGGVCVTVYGEVVGRWVEVYGDGGIEDCGYVWCVVVLGVFGVWRCVEVVERHRGMWGVCDSV